MIQLVLATKNLHKVREIRNMLQGLKGIEVLSLSAFPDYVPPEETGETFGDNARLKAEHAAKELGQWVLADDSGLVVPALQGEPGVFSARYAGVGASDSDNRKKLLEKMKGLDDSQRMACMVCHACLANPNGIVRCEEGICEGTILREGRGGSGFGYDCLFVKHDYQKSFAELEETVKNRVSHRRKAIDRLWHALEELNDLH